MCDTKYYLLMNKDTTIAKLHIDEFDQICIDMQYVDMPYWISDTALFIQNRRAPKHRENIDELLRLSGCDTNKGFIDITHALSLIDTYWVKPIDSVLNWHSVSLYRNSFNETIAKTAFEGGLHGQELSTTSPEYGTDGTFAKCWIREDGQIKMLKRGSSGSRNSGLEPYSEFYASQLVNHFSNSYVNYGLRSHNGRICSVCDIFTSEDYGFIPYSAVDPGNSSYKTVINKMNSLGFADRVKAMFVFDAVIMNEDRHKNNFGFIVNNDTQEIVDFAPLFDHNISLLPYAEEEEFNNIESYLSLKGPRLERSFVLSAKMCLDSDIRRTLINLLDFKFNRHSKFNLPDWRLDALEKVIHNNVIKILA